MFCDRLKSFLVSEGYQYLPSNLPEFCFFYSLESGFVNVFLVIDYEKNRYIAADQHIHIKNTAESLFKNWGIHDVHIMTLVLHENRTDWTDVFCDSFCWTICLSEKKLYASEGQVQDFYGMRKKLEAWLYSVSEITENQEENKFIQRRQPISAVMHRDIPYATAAFVICNILIYVICTFTGDLLYNIGAFHAESIWKEKEYYRWIMSTFLHWDIYHLTSNMLILFYLGSTVEQYFGHIPCILTYILSGISGNLASFLYEINVSADIYSVGASGSVFGIMGAVIVLAFLSKGRWKEITCGRVFFMISYTLYSGMVSDDINNAAHIGGLAGGILVMSVIQILQYIFRKERRGCL